jgi:branched-chain amino acid transport system ATP-binding protein
LLVLQAVHAGYDGSEILHDIARDVRPGEVVLLGRNGVGKTTTLRAIMGALKPRSGRVQFVGRDITRLTPDRINRLGIAMVPEGRRIFPI